MFIDFPRLEIEAAFGTLAKYRCTMEGQLQEFRNGASLTAPQLPDIFSGSSVDEVAQVMAEHEGDVWIHNRRYRFEYPRLYRYSFVVLLYVLFEDSSERICKALRIRNGLDRYLKRSTQALPARIEEFLTAARMLNGSPELARAIPALRNYECCGIVLFTRMVMFRVGNKRIGI